VSLSIGHAASTSPGPMSERKKRRNSPARATPARPPGRRSARSVLLFAGPKHPRTWWIAAGVLALLALGVFLVFALTDLDWASVQRAFAKINPAVERLEPAALIPLMLILPVLGFPIAVVYLIAGARFGPVLGGAVVAACTAVHLLMSYYIGKSVLRGPIQRFIEKRHHHLPQVPEDEQAMICVIAALIPGLPYFVRNYLLVLAGVRLKFMLLVCLPIYVARSYVTILLGNMAHDPTQRALITLVIVDVLKVGICALVIWRLRAHHKHHHPHHDAEHEHAAGAAAPRTGAGK
jgi:uncharacterized membrane protein YdjX (TVP38/TMEM64 family)